MKLTSLGSLTALLALAAPAAAQGMLPYLPKKTVMAISAPDLAAAMAAYEQMPVAKMWAEDEVQTFMADVMELAKEQMAEAMDQMRGMHEMGMLPVSPDALMKLRVNGGTAAITGLEVGAGPFGPTPKIGMLVHLDFGDSAATWMPLLQMGMGMLRQQAGDQLTVTEWSIGDVKATTMAPPEEMGLEMSINMAMVPNGVVFGTITDEVKDVVTNWVNKTPVLSQTAGFAAATKGVDSDGVALKMYLAPDPIVDFGMQAMQMAMAETPEMAMIDFAGIQRALRAMGMRELGTLALSSRYVDGKCVTKGYRAKGGKPATTASSSKIDTKFLRWVPKDAVSFGAGSVQPTSLYDMLVKGMQAYNDQMAEQMLGQLAQMETQMGFSIRGDLFGSLGDHYVTWSMPMGTISSAPEIAVLMKVNDEQKLVGALQKMSAMTQGMIEIEEGTKRGLKSYQVLVNMDEMDEMGGMGMNPFDMLQPTFAFKDGYMVMGFSASDVKRVFKRMDREDNPKGDIRSNKEFMAVADQIPDNISSLNFTDWKANFESSYQMATGMLAFIPMPEEVPIDMSLLPESETLTQHLYASLSYASTDANGAQLVSVDPFGPEAGLALGALVGVGVGVAAWMDKQGGF
jgi:hypothetical protein